jgi:hypothetical protein
MGFEFFEEKTQTMNKDDAANDLGTINELERLRTILYGEQAQATEDRIRDIQTSLKTLESEINAKIQKGEKSLSNQIDLVNKKLDIQISESAEQLSNTRLELEKDFTNRHDDLADQLRELRQQLVDISAALENSKVSRSDLGSMLIEVGQSLLGESE